MAIGMRIVLSVLLTALTFFVLTSLWTFFSAIRPPTITSALTPADFDWAFKSVSFESLDGVRLAGWIVPAARETRKTIVVLHGYPASKGDLLPLSRFLHDDYNLFFLDFRSFGESEGRVTTVGAREVNDLLGAIAYLRSRDDVDAGRLGVFGFSLGGSVGLMAAAQEPAISSVVADSAYANLGSTVDELYRPFGPLRSPLAWLTKLWARVFLGIDVNRVSPESSVAQRSFPILLIHAERDEVIPKLNSERIAAKAIGEKELWIVPNATHGATYALAKEEYEQRIRAFFEKHL